MSEEAQREISNRWATPYLSDGTNLPSVFTRKSLTEAEARYGLKSFLCRPTMDELVRAVKEEDKKYERFTQARGESGVR